MLSSAMPDSSAPRRTLFRTAFNIVRGALALYLAAIAAVALTASPQRADLAVVLGNAVSADRRPMPRLQARLDVAVALYRDGMVPRVLVSGGVEQPGDRDEAAIMAAYLEQHGVPAAAIVQDPAGVDTFETARHTAALLPQRGRVVVVSQWFHLPRTMLAMHRFGLHDVSGAWPRWVEWRDAYSFLREAAALPVYAVRPVGPR